MIDKDILIVAEAAQERLAGPGWVAVDCRFDLADPDAGHAHYEAGHIPGAVFLDLDRDLAGPVTPATGRHPLPDPDTLAARLGELGIGNDTSVLVYDANTGALAARAWWILRWLGHDAVYLLDGGLDRWRALGFVTDSEQPSRTPASFVPRLRDELVVDTTDIAAALASGAGHSLLDARDAARFRGEVEPIDPVAGHVPGAANLPFSHFLNKDGTWKPLEERRALLLEALHGAPEGPWSVMCGSGVTACHLTISALEAGLREPTLYVGSWSEWIRDEKRPVATGAA